MLISNKSIIIWLFFISLILISIQGNSQKSNKRRFEYFELFGGTGTTHYFGDIGGATNRKKLFKKFEDFDPYETRFAFLAGMRYQMSKSFALSFNLIPALLAGDDEFSLNRDRNYRFHSIILDGTLQIEYYYLPWNLKFRPYVFAGMDATVWISNNIFESAVDRRIKLRNTWGTHTG